MHGIILNGGPLEKYYNGDFVGWSWKYHNTSENSMNYAIWRLFLSTAMLANSSPLAAALLAQVGKSFRYSVFWVAECTASIPCVKLEMWLDTAFKPPAPSSSNSYLQKIYAPHVSLKSSFISLWVSALMNNKTCILLAAKQGRNHV